MTQKKRNRLATGAIRGTLVTSTTFARSSFEKVAENSSFLVAEVPAQNMQFPRGQILVVAAAKSSLLLGMKHGNGPRNIWMGMNMRKSLAKLPRTIAGLSSL